ncbi:MAG: hypothetical protein JW940_14350 [Polyangiaceae bacterium]|nr:hypothetical protein [Polyangiaceae bacterium]
MLPAEQMATSAHKLVGIERVMSRFISPILVNSVLGKALAGRADPDLQNMTQAELEAFVDSALVGLRLFVDPADLPELMVELTDVVTETDRYERGRFCRTVSAVYRMEQRGR